MTLDQDRLAIKRRKKKDKRIENFDRNGKYSGKATRAKEARQVRALEHKQSTHSK